MSFDSFEIDPALLAGVRDLGFEQPTDIQQDAIPWALEGRDVLACAMTGSGKTAAFGLPILERLIGLPPGKTRALILSPTRELASQIEEHLAELGAHTAIRVASIYGGVAYEPQEKAFRDGHEILVATPGRLIDHLRRPYANLDDVEVLVLDEADRMLDMGFIPDVRRILQQVPKERQTLFFSATLPAPIVRLANDMLRDPVTINLERKSLPAAGVRQAAYPVRHELKPALLLHLLAKHQVGSALVFCRTRDRADQVGEYLRRAGEKVAVIHGDRTQQHRTKAMDAFKKGNYRVLVATDVAARGIDIEELDVVVNLDVPSAAEDYIHRVGRTARAGATGDAWTFVAARELADLHLIEKSIGKKLERIRPEDFDYSPASLSAISRPPVAVEVPVLDALDEDAVEEDGGAADGAAADLAVATTDPVAEPRQEAATAAEPATGAGSEEDEEEAPVARRRRTRRGARDERRTEPAAAETTPPEPDRAAGDVADDQTPATELSATNEEISLTEKQATGARRGRRKPTTAAVDETEKATAGDVPAADGADEVADKPKRRAAKPAAGRGRGRGRAAAEKAPAATAGAGGVRRPWFLAPLEEDELAAIEAELASEPELIEEEDDVEPPAVERPAPRRDAAAATAPAEERSRRGRGRSRRGRGGRGRREEGVGAAGDRGQRVEPAPPARAERAGDGSRRRSGEAVEERAASGRRPRRGARPAATTGEPVDGTAGVVERFARLRARREGDRLSREVVGGVEDSGRGRGAEGGPRRRPARPGRSEAPAEKGRERSADGGRGGRGAAGRGAGRRAGAEGREASAPARRPAEPGAAPRAADGGRGPRFGASRAAEVRSPAAAAGRRTRPIAEGEAEEQPPSWWSGGPAHGETPGGRRPDSRRPAHSRAAEALAAKAQPDLPRPQEADVADDPAPPAARRPAKRGARRPARRDDAAAERSAGGAVDEAAESPAPRAESPALERFAALRARRAQRGGGEADRS